MAGFREEISYITRGHNLLIYVPWTMDKLLLLIIAFAILLPTMIIFAIPFGLMFVLTYFTVCRFLGKWDYFKGTWKAKSELEWENNPAYQKLEEKIDRIWEKINNATE